MIGLRHVNGRIADAGRWRPSYPHSDRAIFQEGHAMSIRPVKRIVKSTPAIEGAGVKLHRAFGFGNTGDFDPFLLLDDFRNDRPEDYRAGFPWHPHRGIETITYVLAGTMDDGRTRHTPPGDAAGRSARPDARLPALGKPAIAPQNDVAPIPGYSGGGDSRRRR